MRVDGWQDKFFAYLEAARDARFSWGSFDCCMFASSVIDLITGSELTAQLSTKYSDEATALAYIASFGSLAAAVSSWLGVSRPPNSAGPGDIVIANFANGPIVGVCLGRSCAFASVNGLLYTERDPIIACWSI